MQGYYWAKTPENELLIVLVHGGKGYVPGVDSDIPLDELFILEPVQWPTELLTQNRSLAPPTSETHAADRKGQPALRLVSSRF